MAIGKQCPEQTQEENMLYVPDTMANLKWPWPRRINLHYEEVQAQSAAWFHSFNAFDERSKAAFDACDFGRLAALGYPLASKEHLRTGCDLMHLFWLIDEYTDFEPAPVVRQMIDIIVDALKTPSKSRPKGEIFLGQMTKEFWQLALKSATPSAAQRFVDSFTEYLESVVTQAEDRDSDRIRTIEEYFPMRRENNGARPSFAVGELHLDLPDDAIYHPVVQEMRSLIADLMIVDNDIVSYNREQADGNARHNILTVVMHQHNTDLDGAMEWACGYYERCQEQFLRLLDKVPSFGPKVDKDLHEYINNIANWARANYCWCYETERYFGKRSLEVQKTRMVPLLPKFNADRGVEHNQVVIPLIPL